MQALATQVVGVTSKATARQLDRLVYELYGLTEEEIRIAEETMIGRFRGAPPPVVTLRFGPDSEPYPSCPWRV